MASALERRDLLDLSSTVPPAEVISRNKQALLADFRSFLNPSASWGDGFSVSMLDTMHHAGVDRALLLLGDLYGKTPRPDVVAHADKLGFLIGPYDSYHSIHSPAAKPDDTWETAQFDAAAYEHGRVINADGSPHGGFKGRGFHFSPEAAWPYMQQRVNSIYRQSPYSAWFVDCDATAECFEDYSAEHPATMLNDTKLRRQRLSWLESEHRLVVGSEGGSVLFADVIHFGHGPHTPYIGHLDPSFRDPKSPYYTGRAWPPDNPDGTFKPTPLPPSLKVPYFDPSVRIPLYRAALGDEIIATHHWSFDSFKLGDVETSRELLELLYMVPPMYHMNRLNWPKRQERILRHLAFWGPLHRELATAPLTHFECLSKNRLLQRTTFRTPKGDVSITVNFSDDAQANYPPLSATVAGPIATTGQALYRAKKS
jgi:hypothetical protein